jgi:sugar phosphate isomerase/epimerase
MYKNLSTTALGVTVSESELIELSLTFGFRGLELDVPDLLQRIERFDLAHARRLIDSAKMEIGEFALPFALDADETTYRIGLSKLIGVAEIVGGLGARRCVATMSPASDDSPYHENFERHRSRFAEIGEVLAKNEIALGIGFSAVAAERQDRAFEFIHDAQSLSVLLSATTAPNVGVIIDTWHLHASGGSPEQLEQLGAERIVAVYLSDAPADVAAADLTAEQRTLPGETGTIDTSALLARLVEMGYDGPITPAADRAALEGLKRDDIIRRAAETLDTVWKAAGLSPTGKLLPTASAETA